MKSRRLTLFASVLVAAFFLWITPGQVQAFGGGNHSVYMSATPSGSGKWYDNIQDSSMNTIKAPWTMTGFRVNFRPTSTNFTSTNRFFQGTLEIYIGGTYAYLTNDDQLNPYKLTAQDFVCGQNTSGFANETFFVDAISEEKYWRSGAEVNYVPTFGRRYRIQFHGSLTSTQAGSSPWFACKIDANLSGRYSYIIANAWDDPIGQNTRLYPWLVWDTAFYTQMNQWTVSSSQTTNSLDTLNNSMVNIQSTLEINRQEDKDELQNAQNQAQNQADSAQIQIDSTTTSLIGVIDGFITTLSNVQPTDCNLRLDAGNVDFGEVDICQLSPPNVVVAAIAFLTSFFVFRFVVHLWNLMLALLRSITT